MKTKKNIVILIGFSKARYFDSYLGKPIEYSNPDLVLSNPAGNKMFLNYFG